MASPSGRSVAPTVRAKWPSSAGRSIVALSAIEGALDLPLQRREEYRHQQREEDLAHRRSVLIVEERVRRHQETQEGHARHQHRG